MPEEKLITKIRRNIRVHRLFNPSETIVVGVSAGLDSTVLLRLLVRLAPENDWRLIVAHLDHRLRGAASRADAGLVRRTAKELGLPLHLENRGVRDWAERHKQSLEMAARQLRHEFFAKTATLANAGCVALAHHADDQLEHFFIRLLRGSGLQGLGGMSWTGLSPMNRNVRLVRPLLNITKAELQEFATEQKLAFREDATNADLSIPRNRIRHELLPLLRQRYQPALDTVIGRTMEMAMADAAVVDMIAEQWLERKTPEFAKLARGLQRRVVWLQLLQHGIPPEYDLIEKLRGNTGLPVQVLGGKCLVLTEKGEVLTPPTPAGCEFSFEELSANLGVERGACFGGVNVQWELKAARGRFSPEPRPGREVFDADKVGPSVLLRHWRPGDRFQPIGMQTHCKLQDLFTNARIPRKHRHQLILACDLAGEIFWVESLRISERHKVDQGTIRRLHWSWQRH